MSYVECETIEHYEDGRDWRGAFVRSVESHKKELRQERAMLKSKTYQVFGRTRHVSDMTDKEVDEVATDEARRLTESTIREVAEKESITKQRRGQAR